MISTEDFFTRMIGTPGQIYVSFLQGILPYAAYSGIKELFVPEEKVEEAKKEAEELPSVELTKVGPALVRIHCDWMSQNQNLKKSNKQPHSRETREGIRRSLVLDLNLSG